MVTEASAAIRPGRSPDVLARDVDRWIFVAMAALFVATALAGFVPTSLGKLAAVQAGQRPPFPLVLHVHAVLMAAWLLLLLLLLAQTTLAATGRRELHMQLGVAALVLVPAMLVTWYVLVPTMFGLNWAMLRTPPPQLDAASVETTRKFLSSLVLVQARIMILFPLFVGWALLARKRDPGTHKRMMILATVLPLPAAIDRLAWLPSSYPESALTVDLYTLLWVSPLFAWDLVRHGRVHRACIWWFVLNVPCALAVQLLWWSPAVTALAPKLLGAEPW